MSVKKNHYSHENEFFKLMKECRRTAGENHMSLSSHLLQLQEHLGQLNHEEKYKNENNGQSFSSQVPLHDFATALLELETVRTGSPSDKRVQDQIDKCLDLCGYKVSLIAAIKILRDASTSNPDLFQYENCMKDNSISIPQVVSSMYAVKRLLLVIPEVEYDEYGNYETLPNFFYVVEEFVSDWRETRNTAVPDENFSSEIAIKQLIDMIILLPTQIANACYGGRIQLPSWATRSKMYSRLFECSALMALIGGKEFRENERFIIKEAGIERVFCAHLLKKLVHLGCFESASSGMHKFWKGRQNSADAASVLMRAGASIKSPRQSASLLCSIIKRSIAQIELYSAEMNSCHVNSLCRKYCMPYLESVWLPILQTSSMIRDALVHLAIFSPSSTADKGEIKLIVRCIVLLLASCGANGAEGLENLDSDSESCQSEFDLVGNEILMISLAEVATIWSDSSFINKTDVTRQHFVSYFIMYAIEFMDKVHHENSRLQQTVAQELVEGITNRLKVTEITVRTSGMTIAEHLAPILGQTLRFEELDGCRDDVNKVQETDGSETKTVISLEHPESPKKEHRRRKILNYIDPDEVYCSDDDSDSSSASDADEDDSIWSSDSEWDEDNLMILRLEDDEDDLRVIAKPNYLRECLDLLRSDGDDHEAICKQEAALREIPILVRDMPPDLVDVSVSLSNELFHLENKFDIAEFDQLRYEGLCSLAACEPTTTIDYLQSQLFIEISMVKRFEVLEVMKYSSSELCGQQQLEEYRKLRNENDVEIPKVSGKRQFVREDEQQSDGERMNSISKNTLSRMKTRRWGRGHGRAQSKCVTNRFGPIAPIFFYPILHRFLTSKSDEVLWGGESGGTLLSHLIVALSTFVENSGFHPGTAVLAKDLFELSWSFFIAENGEVRQAVLIALATCISHLPEDYILQVVVGTEEVPRILATTVAIDTNENCRLLAAAIQNSLQQSIML